ncbi:hypothetical protein ACGF12_32375 [Kitasatospora sp. NPDC048296]|uniref:hypothetical protein n=1 Tax=Kitasatospora sp. NPDC048296 TaxID=3364048 RepID=UPI0037168566
MITADPLTDADLADIQERADAATPGPWYVQQLDDEFAMSLVAISTVADIGLGERWPDFDHHHIAAATLVQQPRRVDIAEIGSPRRRIRGGAPGEAPRHHGSDHWRAGCRETGASRSGRGRRKRTRTTGTSSAAYFT